MAKITLTPQSFSMVNYDAPTIEACIDELATKIGLPGDAEIVVNVDERSPLARTRLLSISPITIDLEGGALEDPTRPREWGRERTVLVFGRLLLRASDRLDPSFGDAPDETDLSLQQVTAWDAYSFGRLERLGYNARKPRAQYHFRNRHGFTDVADAVFERLWTSEHLSFADLDRAVEETQAAKQPA